MISNKKGNLTKVYCERCDIVFNSREKFQEHLKIHSSSVSCETCPLDTAIQKIFKLFKRN